MLRQISINVQYQIAERAFALIAEVSKERLNLLCKIKGPEELFKARSLQTQYQSPILLLSIALLN